MSTPAKKTKKQQNTERAAQVSALTDKLTKGEISTEAFKAAIMKLQVPDSAPRSVSIKVGEKGGMVVRLPSQRVRPTTLYASQWPELIAATPQMLEFLYAHKDEFSFLDGQSLPQDRVEFTRQLISALQAQVDALEEEETEEEEEEEEEAQEAA